VVPKNYEKRLLSLKNVSDGSEPACSTVPSSREPTNNIVLSTSNILAPSPTVVLPTVSTKEIVQLTSSILAQMRT
jgi:hypothetical protein